MFRQYRRLEPNEFIVVGCDTASGGLDYSAAQFLSKTKLDVPLVYHSSNTTAYMTDDLLPVLERIEKDTGIRPVIAYETNNGGSFELDRLARLNKLTTTAFTEQQIINFPIPLRLDKNSAIRLTNTFSVGASTTYILVYGYEVED